MHASFQKYLLITFLTHDGTLQNIKPWWNLLLKSAKVSKDAGFDEWKDFWIRPSSFVPSLRNANHFKISKTPFLRMNGVRRVPWFRNKKSFKWHIENHSTHSIWGLIWGEILWNWCMSAIWSHFYFVREDVFIAV